MLLPHPRPPGPPGPPVIRGSHSQPTNPSQVRFAPEMLSHIERPVNHPTTSTTSNFINTVPRISANVNTTPAQNSDLVTSSTNSEMIKGIVNEFNRHRFTYLSSQSVQTA